VPERALKVVSWALLALLLQFHVRQIVTSSVLYDDAFIATAAKNVAMGAGYASSYHSVDLFDPEISTGPVIVLPAALLMGLLGNRYWVPGLAITIAIWATLLLLMVGLRRLGGRWHHLAVAVTAGGVIVFGTNEFGMLGELPAVFLVVLAFALLADESGSDVTNGLGAGVALGLAIYAKLTVAIALPAVLLMPWLMPASQGRGRANSRWRRLAWCCAGLALPTVAWQVFQLAALSWNVEAWAGVKSRQLAFLMGTQSLSGIGQLQEAPTVEQALLRNIFRSTAALSGYFGDVWRLLPALAAMALALRLTITSPIVPAAAKRVSWLLLSAVSLHLGWWLVVSPTGWYRHLLPAIVYAVVLGGILAASAMAVSRRVGIACVLGYCLTVALIMPAWYPRSGDFARVFRWDFDRDPRLSALLQTRDEVMRLQQNESAILVGCGWWVPRDLEYVLPGVNNFRDCFRLRPEDVASKRILLVRNEFYNWDNQAILDRYRDACDARPVYKLDPFVVSECPGLPR
jgi:4-amino-4-deoxy-L-arabinose transferase-like glycosyltransferase